ncbi:PadR family transcriptional regulator [Variovorax saccharolyticus]|uniref:PadR family transcriptional regulator n=1 Tax=Variovorax saccharolyticus TaxID=3053516 RepID=UPI00257509AA|nr:PadR family transcriptional regulator [Variovorax sp. J22R187]MDM0019308.1 PadR family transcriptional regulator [Variovorax sp. J22R187]
MSLPHALLTALVERPGSGSELASRFDRSIAFFWQATHQQIYRELARLEESGWVQSLPAEQGRGRKRAYKILPAGRKELKRWVLEIDDPASLREPLMVRLRADAALGPTGLDKEIARRLAIHVEKLAVYREIEARDFADVSDSRQKQVQHLVLQAGIMLESLWVQWSKNALKVLERRD